MSGEQLTLKELKKTLNSNSFLKSKSRKVDINDLLTKVRHEKNKEKKENLIFVGSICGVVAVTGIIVSF